MSTNFSQKLTQHARHSLKEADTIAHSAHSDAVRPEHLLLGVLLEETSLGSLLLENIGFQAESLTTLFSMTKRSGRSRTKKQTTSPSLPLSTDLKEVLRHAYLIAHRFQYPYVGTEHLVYALFATQSSHLDTLFTTMRINRQKATATLKSHLNLDQFPHLSKMLDLPESPLTHTVPHKHTATPFLDQYALDMATSPAFTQDTLIGRQTEINRIIQILTRKQKNNPLLIGEPGVGKTALVAALAKKIVTGDVPHTLLHKRILSLDLTLVVAGTNFRGEFEARLKEILTETMRNPDIILFIDEIHTMVGAGNTSGGLDAANILKPALSRGEIRCIGATTFAEYKRHIEKDPALDRRFQSVHIAEPTLEEAKEILYKSKKSYEDFHHISLSSDIIDLACNLSVRYIPDRFLPDKALDIIDEASALAKQQRPMPESLKTLMELEREHATTQTYKDTLIREEQYDDAAIWHEQEKNLRKKISGIKAKYHAQPENERIVVTKEHILKTVAHIARIPSLTLSDTTPRQKLLHLRNALEQYLVGQAEATTAIEQTLARSLGNVTNPDRPLGSFLFLGPTGVGKTLTAKIIAEEFFGNSQALIRLDMSEFMERHSVAQILGAPAGYIGYGDGGKLTERVRRQPYSVILFDEIEKAHPDVFNILLQILDEGMLTDAEGRKINFRNTLIILTSNVGTTAFTQSTKIGFDKQSANDVQARFETIKQEVLTDLKKDMRPELLARLDHIIVFNALNQDTIQAIVKRELDILVQRLKQQAITLTYPTTLVRHLAKQSFSPEQGARLVRKTIQDVVEKSIAEILIDAPKKKSLRLSLKHNTVLCA
ncbi:MAG: ATP-dependent Clp protease ATP-binding subunit [Minisyncoccota bacterium]